MHKSRPTFRGLMAAIALLGIEFAALRSGSSFWFSTIYTLTVVLLLVATLAAKYQRAGARAFWFGFALFGWAYLLLVLGPWSSSHSRDSSSDFQRANPDVLTTRLLWSFLHKVRGSAGRYEVINEFAECTMGLAHLMLTLIFAIAGGWAAVILRRRRTRAEVTTAVAAPSRSRITPFLVLGGTTLLFLLGARSMQGRSGPAYFPDLAFDREEESNRFTVEWYSNHLRTMREPSLWELAQGDRAITAYRLLWLPSFDHPACVRITRTGVSATLRVVVLDGLGGYEPGQIVIDKTVNLAEKDWSEIERQLDQIKYWSLPTKREDDGGSDGDQLILESSSPGRYHIVDRWDPDAEYLKVCRTLAEMSGIRMRRRLDSYHGQIP